MDTAWSKGVQTTSPGTFHLSALSSVLLAISRVLQPQVLTHHLSTCTPARKSACHYRHVSFRLALWVRTPGPITVVRGMWCFDWSGPNHMLHAPPHQLCDGVQSLARTQSACWSQRSGYLWEWGQKWLRGHRASSRRAGNVLYLDLGLPTRVHTYTNTHWIETLVVQASR